jgi:DNA-directed RNA polymerase subunit RPC12/RpoP
MVMEFVITPHTKNIIIGRGLGKDDIMVCAAKICLQREKEIGDMLAKQEEKQMNPVLIDSDWGKEIEVTGFVICPRCNYKVLYPDHVGEYDVNHEERAYLLCPACKLKIPMKEKSGKYTVTWTTEVVSKHRRHKHSYYHKPCWENMFIGGEEE